MKKSEQSDGAKSRVRRALMETNSTRLAHRCRSTVKVDMSDFHELLFSHSEDIQNIARHARQTKDPQSFVVAVLDLLDRHGRSLAVARLGAEAVDHFATQSHRRHISPVKVTDVTCDEIDRVFGSHTTWIAQKTKPLDNLCVHVAVVINDDFFYSRLVVPEN